MKRLTVRGHVSTFTGYGQMLCEIVAGLDKLGVYCSIRPSDVSEPFGSTVPVEIKAKFVTGVQPEEWELLIRSPWESPTPFKKTIFYTMWESTILPKEYVALLNKAKQIIVPSPWNKDGFQRSGVSIPIDVVPLGISEEIFSYIPPRPVDGKFIIGIAGRVNHGPKRKGIQRSFEIFKKAFATEIKDVELRVKVHPDDETPEIKDPRIIVDKCHFTWAQMRQWFANLDIFLSMATVEGFGLLQLQAMACGRPVVAASYGGMNQFLTPDNGFCLPHSESRNTDYGGGMWAEINEDTAVDQLRRCYEKREEIPIKGEKAALTATQFTWAKSVDQLHKLLTSIGAL